MARRKIVITRDDLQHLQYVLNTDSTSGISEKPYLRALRGELDKASVVASDKVPPNVVTMNSTVRLRHMKDREEDIYTLVYPNDADISERRLSVLAPIGTAILGNRVGDSVKWEVPSGTIRVRIEELLYQPERDGMLV